MVADTLSGRCGSSPAAWTNIDHWAASGLDEVVRREVPLRAVFAAFLDTAVNTAQPAATKGLPVVIWRGAVRAELTDVADTAAVDRSGQPTIERSRSGHGSSRAPTTAMCRPSRCAGSLGSCPVNVAILASR